MESLWLVLVGAKRLQLYKIFNGLAYAVTKLAVRGLAVQRDPGRHYVTSCLVKHQSAASLLLRKTCDTIACDGEGGVDLCGHQTFTVLE